MKRICFLVVWDEEDMVFWWFGGGTHSLLFRICLTWLN